MRIESQKGVALITALLVLFLVSTLMIGLSWMVMSDQRLGGNYSARESAFYGAEAGMEKLTADVGTTFTTNGYLTTANIATIQSNPPVLPGITFMNAANLSTYSITCNGCPNAVNGTILPPSPYSGLQALINTYSLSVAAQTAAGSEVELKRQLQTASIPVFQFGIFSNVDLGFHAGSNFAFGGRVHTNGNLWLASDSCCTLTLSDKVTAAKEIVRSNLMNGIITSTGGYAGPVMMTTNPGGSNYVALGLTQGSVNGTNSVINNVNTSLNEPTFENLAANTYNSNIGNAETGVTPLSLGIVMGDSNGQTIDLIRLPTPNEQTANPIKYGLRYYSQASLRILLSDYGPSGTCTDSDLTSLSGISAGTPLDLKTLAWPSAYATTAPSGYTGAGVYPLPVVPSGIYTAGSPTYNSTYGYWIQSTYPTITGCIKIDYQNAAGTAFTDVTNEILELGFTGKNIYPTTSTLYSAPSQPLLPTSQVAPQGANGSQCGKDPSPNAVIRLARLRDNPTGSAGNVASRCTPTASGIDYWPNVLYDAREGTLRDGQAPSATGITYPATLGGSMYYIELDVANLSRWFTGAIGVNGPNANNTSGYTVYFSDRRGDQKDPNPPPSVSSSTYVKTGGYGYEDEVNYTTDPTNGCPNSALEQGEDAESDYGLTGLSQNSPATYLRTYGMMPTFTNYTVAPPMTLPSTFTTTGTVNGATFLNVSTTSVAIKTNTGFCSAMGNTWPLAVADVQDIRENPPLLFRRALKLVNASTISLGTCNTVICGLTVAAENPVYIQGDYNNPGASPTFTAANVSASVVADAVTVLSDNWNDINSFISLANTNTRTASQTTYSTAIIAGKSIPFPNVGPSGDTGSDGGVHNFLHYLENWAGSNIYYQGSFVTFYYSHQAMGSFKCCTTVYGVPSSRSYIFDNTFLTPSLLPPRTPMLRSVNTIGFTQVLTAQ
ncbi:MAG: PilX N-terminal domain-containing pilus assembly protein [Candidatus Acidiferrales bacterium]